MVAVATPMLITMNLLYLNVFPPKLVMKIMLLFLVLFLLMFVPPVRPKELATMDACSFLRGLTAATQVPLPRMTLKRRACATMDACSFLHGLTAATLATKVSHRSFVMKLFFRMVLVFVLILFLRAPLLTIVCAMFFLTVLIFVAILPLILGMFLLAVLKFLLKLLVVILLTSTSGLCDWGLRPCGTTGGLSSLRCLLARRG